ncbi:MAG: hypothetical protein V4700_01545 [Pseudomonadota bacterium]
MIKSSSHFKWYIYLLPCLIFCVECANALTPLTPRLSSNIYASDSTVGQADVMLSLEGDQDHNLYLDPQAAYSSDQQWFGDLGLGYRWIQNDAAILGGYVFAGHTRLDHNSGFWIANPGVEAMGSRWDAHLNAYIPLAGRSDDLGSFELNIVSDPVFRGHSLIVDSVFNNVNEIQRIGNGADARLAYQLFRHVPLKGYVGAYFFDIPGTDKLRGGAAGFEYWFGRQFKFFANYTYDNVQHSTVATGLGISFGGVRKQMADPSLSERLMDPVERHLANLGHASGIPSRMFFNEGNGSSSQILLDNIAFFSQAGMPNNGGSGLTLANCTFENPCGPTDLTNVGAITLNTLLPNTTMYFNGGSYDALNVPAGTNPVTLQAGQSVHSRTTDYSQPATGIDRSTFNGAFFLNSNNTLENIILQPTAATLSGNGVAANNASNVLITGSQIGSASNRYVTAGVAPTNNSQLTLDNVAIFAAQRGIRANNSSILMQSSQIDAFRSSGFSSGLTLVGSNVEIDNSQINVGGRFVKIGIDANDSNGSTVTINDTNITVDTTTASNATGLLTSAQSQIQMGGGALSVSSLLLGSAQLTQGPNIVLNGVTCTLNGTTVSC